VAVVLGAELGTTVKIVIGSIGGIAAKKRVALGNTFFNLVSTALGFIFLSSIVDLLHYIIGDKDPLFVLVAFQTFVNIGGAILFYFFLNKLGDYLDNSFKGHETHATLYLQNASIETPDAAILMIEKEVNAFVERVIFMQEEIFSMQEIKGKKYFEEKTITLFKSNMSLTEKYELLKKTEGEMLLFYNKLLSENIETTTLNRINGLLNSVRSAMYAAKGFKDVMHNVVELDNSSNELKYKRFKGLQIELDKFNSSLKDILCETDKTKVSDNLYQLLIKVELYYKQDILHAYQTLNIGVQNELEISTMFNFNHEVFSSCKSLIFSIKDLLLSETEAAKFENLYTQ